MTMEQERFEQARAGLLVDAGLLARNLDNEYSRKQFLASHAEYQAAREAYYARFAACAARDARDAWLNGLAREDAA